MKYCLYLLMLCSILVSACKNTSPETSKDKKEKSKEDQTLQDSGITSLDSTKLAMLDMIPVKSVPQVAKQNWAYVFSDDKKHTAGIFRLWNDQQIRDFVATMEYAPEKDIKSSIVFEPKADWWVKRDIKTAVLNNKLVTYRKKEGKNIWYFAINKNQEVYFWK